MICKMKALNDKKVSVGRVSYLVANENSVKHANGPLPILYWRDTIIASN